MDVMEMTREDFERVPYRENWSSEGVCDSIVILPAEIPEWRFWWYQVRYWLARCVYRVTNRNRVAVRRVLGLPEEADGDWRPLEPWRLIPGLHDSNFRCIDYVAVIGNEPVCRLSGCSDVLHLDGIGGYGYRWVDRFARVPDSVPVAGWQFDCLPRSGLLRLWPSNGGPGRLLYGMSISSFEVYYVKDGADSA